MTQLDIALIAHLMRRAGFGATREELDAYAERGYEATVEDLLDPKDTEWLGDDMVRRFDLEASGMINAPGSSRNWVYRMITTNAPLLDKMASSGTASSPRASPRSSTDGSSTTR